ncbi:xanthine dehydrogenase/oxidase-like [Liolophura sinensis]|uniref:xanthine dehydrogenase/oxidase-like n=1 Tax=Liolophura sinensis TaxID=3198878 RepID=UPI003158A6B8
MAVSTNRVQPSVLVFYVNGKKITDDGVDPETTLLQYLRVKLRLTGTKLSCGEGGCGACTVMLSRYDKASNNIKHMTVMACMYPMGEVHGMAVTTVEGIGSLGQGMHPVQERIAKAHGSQCGFCTPGMVMSMYCLLKNNPTPSEEQVERELEGNLCRCTGYRPILDGFKTFAKECPMGENCCQRGGTEANEDERISTKLFNPKEFTPYDPSQDPIFPPELQRTETYDKESLRLVGERVMWYRPLNLEELLALKTKFPDAKLVRGNTGLGLSKIAFPVLISISRISELSGVRVSDEGIRVGSATTLSELDESLQEARKTLPDYKTRVIDALLKSLSRFANHQIRNVASIGGNVLKAHGVSDLQTVLLAAGVTLTMVTSAGKRKSVVIGEDTTCEELATDTDLILLDIFIPHPGKHEYFHVSKESLRRTNDSAIVISAIKVTLREDTDEIKSISLSYGGISAFSVLAKIAMKSAVGRVWEERLVSDMCQWLREDISLSPGSSGGMTEYRQILASSLFFRFYLTVADQHCRYVGKQSGVPPSQQSGSCGLKRDPSSGLVFHEEVSPGQPVEDPIGRSVVMPFTLTHATGESVFLDDIPPYSNELHLGRVMSTKAHAKILNIDPTEALKMPGVVEFVTYKDVPGKNYWLNLEEELFASVEVTVQGQTIAAILADTHEHAVRAARAVKVEYEELEAVITIEDAIKANSFYFPKKVFVDGDIEAGFREADHVIEKEMRIGGQEHYYMETQSCLAVPQTEYRQMEVISATQFHALAQMVTAEALAVPSNYVICKSKRLGGAFGGKILRSAAHAAITAVAANKCGRPVRCVLDRDEDMASTGTRHPFLAKYKVGISGTRITALDMEFYCNAGNASLSSGGFIDKSILHTCNTFKVPNIRVTGYACKTNITSCNPMRAFACVQMVLASEDFFGLVHEENMYREGDVTPSGQVLKHYNVRKCWKQCYDTSDYLERSRAVEIFNSENRWKKRGIAMTTTNQGISNTDTSANQAGALVQVYKDGSVLLAHGGSEMGQGLNNKMIQIASRVLRIPYSRIHISSTSTETVPNSSPSGASITADVNGMAVKAACETIMDRLDTFTQENPNGNWTDWVMAAYKARVSLSATGFYRTPDLNYNTDTLHGEVFNYFTTGAACSEVEIDCLTGEYQILRTDIVMDVGSSLNPAVDIGQIQGAFVQGCGLMLTEQLKITPDGKVLTRGPFSYKVPTVRDIPQEFKVSLLKGTPNPRAVYSSKGIGEPPVALAASVFLAIKDAIMSARFDSGLSENFQLDSPATIDKIRLACTDRFTKEFPIAEPGTFKPWFVDL